jgi:3-phenylpropionate/trans-cinnamate dioxygenase ferredoxin reductase component
MEPEERLLARVASPELSRFLTEYHLERGMKILTSAQVSELRPGARGRVASVVLDGGREIKTDRVLHGDPVDAVSVQVVQELASSLSVPSSR